MIIARWSEMWRLMSEVEAVKEIQKIRGLFTAGVVNMEVEVDK